MEKLHTYDEFLNENLNEALKEGDSVTHRIFAEIKGTVIAGPMKYSELEKSIPGIDLPEEDDVYIKPYINKPVWIAILLDDKQTKFGATTQEFK